jgi:hypothetical protein
VKVVSASNVARATSTRAAIVECLVHRREHRGMLTHPEIIVGTPHGHFADAAAMVMSGTGKRTSLTLQISE